MQYPDLLPNRCTNLTGSPKTESMPYSHEQALHLGHRICIHTNCDHETEHCTPGLLYWWCGLCMKWNINFGEPVVTSSRPFKTRLFTNKLLVPMVDRWRTSTVCRVISDTVAHYVTKLCSKWSKQLQSELILAYCFSLQAQLQKLRFSVDITALRTWSFGG